jgi:hypothetical protein
MMRLPHLRLLALLVIAAGPAEALRISGQVTLSDEPADLSGSVVRILAGNLSAVTDAAGRYLIDGVAAGTYQVEAGHLGYRTDLRTNVALSADAVLDFQLLRVHSVTVTVELTGTTVGLAGTQLTLSGPEGNRFGATDALGSFRFDDLIAGDYTVYATRTCFVPGSAQVTVSADTSTRIELAARRFTVRGSVLLEGVTGDQSGTSVALTLSGVQIAGATTDPLGAYSFEQICPGGYALEASRPGYRTQTTAVTVIGATDGPTLKLSPVGPFTLSGVVRVTGGDPSGVAVRVEELDLAAALSGADGTFRLEGIPYGVYTVQAQKQGYSPARVPRVAIHADTLLELVLHPSLPIRRESPGCGCGEIPGSTAPVLIPLLLVLGLFRGLRRRRTAPAPRDAR